MIKIVKENLKRNTMGKNAKKSLGINALLNAIKSGLSIFFPLITYPYALRVLGADGIGKVSFCNSIISYFSMLAMLGVATYGVREGAKIKKNTWEFNQFTNELFTINMLSAVTSYVLLFAAVFYITKLKPYALLLAIQSTSILFTVLGFSWINIVYEDYLIVTVRSIIIHFISLIFLFLFVKTSDDYYTYAFFGIIGSIVVCITNWFYVRRYVIPKLTIRPRLKKHFKPLILMFSNSVAISVYVNLDTTMLGWMRGDVEVGLYSVSVRIYTTIKGLLAAVYSVAIPRLAEFLGENNEEEYRNLYTSLWRYLSIILIPSSVGLICVSKEVMYFMGGGEYLSATLSLQILSIALVFAIFGGLITAVLNITIAKEKDNLLATSMSAVINFVLNLVFIPLLGLYGAAVTTLLSEAFVFVFCVKKNPEINKYLSFAHLKRDLADAFFGSGLIIIVTAFLKFLIQKWIIRLLLIPIFGVLVYGAFMLYINNQTCVDLLNRIKYRLNRYKL